MSDSTGEMNVLVPCTYGVEQEMADGRRRHREHRCQRPSAQESARNLSTDMFGPTQSFA